MYTLPEIDSIIEKGILSLNLKGEPKELYQPIEYIISIGGKRIRPRLCLLTYSLFSDEVDTPILYPAMALEIFHAFTLIHDDIMDKASLRRGQKTIHVKWNENIAILSGDVMSIKAYQYIAHAPNKYLDQALALFSKTAAQVCEGQQLDMNYEKEPIITISDYLGMIGLKTAVLLACSAKLGAVLGGADEKTANALYDYGYRLGIAFQITDDYLDVYADPMFFGKNIGGDIVNNKKSWMLVESMRVATGSFKEELDRIMGLGEESADEKIAAMQQLYENLGVKDSAEKEIERYYLSALQALDDIQLDDTKMELLADFAARITYRKK